MCYPLYWPARRAVVSATTRRSATWTSALLLLVLCATHPNRAWAQAADVEGTITGTVLDAATGDPVVGANIMIEGTLIGTVTNSEGTYTLSLAPGSVDLRASYIGYTSVTEEVTVAPEEAVEKNFRLQEDLIGMGELVVTGTRSNERSVIESAVPIDVLSAEELQGTGQIETAQLLQVMAPSIDFPRQAMGDGTETVRPVYFRGLGPDQVLVLVNGKRRHIASIRSGSSTAGVDLNAIPAGAIERIEILRDGASAQYGSDAVSGVINVILSEEAGTNLSARTGIYREGDGETIATNLSHGFNLPSGGFLHFSGDFRYSGLVNRAGPDGNQQYWGTQYDDDGNVTYDPVAERGIDEDYLNELWAANPEVTFRFGDPKTIGGGLFFNGEFPLSASSSTTLYSFGGLTSRYAESSCYFRRPNQSDRVTMLQGYGDGFLPLYSNYTTDASVSAGLKGNVSAWSWDVSSTYGGNFFDRNLKDTHNATYGPLSPTRMDIGTHTFQQVVNNVDVFRSFDAGLASPLAVSVGGELRFENYQIGAGQPESYLDGGFRIPFGPDAGEQASVGCQCFPGFRPSDEVDDWRSNAGVYLDLSADLTSALFLTGAVRFENYSDFGTALTYKVASRFELMEGVALRGAFNTGFRAPALLQSYYSSTQTGFFTNDDTGEIEGREVRTFRLNEPAALALGATALEPETSRNFSGGLTFNPLPELVFTADYYNIRVYDRVVLTSNFFRSNPLVAELFDNAGLYEVQGGRFFTNAINTLTYGLDLVARYGLNLGTKGQLRFTGSANFTRNSIKDGDVVGTPPQLAELEESIFNEESEMAFELSYPRQNLSLMLNYDVKNFGVMLRGWRPGEIIGAETMDFDDGKGEQRLILDGYNRVPPTLLMDLELTYRFANGFTFAVGGTNIFDKRPPLNQTVEYRGQTFNGSFNGNFPYVNQFNNSFGVAGAFYYTRFSYTF